MRVRFALIAGFASFGLVLTPANSEPLQFCVKCVDPSQTYVCRIDTTQQVAPVNGMQLYCMVRTSKEGGHRSCAIDDTPISSCAGPVKSYALSSPNLSPRTREAIERYRNRAASRGGLPLQGNGEPETLVGASKKGLQSTGQAVGGAARGVGKAAGKVGSATKKTGSAVGGATRRAYDCVKSLFRECGSSRETQ
ncbi:MAG: hypothetical protein MPJ78_01710 [Hyphomicrobiaceae bacterium]|nr:hypothetical protein [Hyphomicrobiaceae bacterium]